ncbi:hypothetical protein F2P45_06300 [Massilia sp. CCM 8733]|uniref:Uncharacterized protein n=1 Tax=Massilia mucilaginosa TaxID=2609282 RepID=A0ABX0NPE5_9BURK|nr:hypothetical protein [Massilia mucilaginosa]NHZ88635.1 hypothetical protein [Massilia mucilaginosa]
MDKRQCIEAVKLQSENSKFFVWTRRVRLNMLKFVWRLVCGANCNAKTEETRITNCPNETRFTRIGHEPNKSHGTVAAILFGVYPALTALGRRLYRSTTE